MRRLCCAFIVVVSAALAGCSASTMNPSTAGSMLNVVLKDAPFNGAKALLVTFSEVTAHSSGSSDFKLSFAGGAATRTCDLMKLTSAQDVLGTGPLDSGHYTQIRLVVTSATLYFDNASSGAACAPAIATPAGAMAPVVIPSGEIKLNREFDVTSSGATTILVDFDGDKSVKATGSGQFMMAPVVTIVSVQ
jgi:hypothetical protein